MAFARAASASVFVRHDVSFVQSTTALGLNRVPITTDPIAVSGTAEFGIGLFAIGEFGIGLFGMGEFGIGVVGVGALGDRKVDEEGEDVELGGGRVIDIAER